MLHSKMTPAQQTAMNAYGFKTWPPTHNRTHNAANCRASAAVTMREQGYGGTAIAKAIGYCDKESACGSIRNYLRNQREGITQ